RLDGRLLEDPLEDLRVGEEVLAQSMAGPQAGVAERPADVGRVDREAGAGHRRAGGSEGLPSSARSERSPARNRRAPAAPIRAPLSVHSAGRGTIRGSPCASASPA